MKERRFSQGVMLWLFLFGLVSGPIACALPAVFVQLDEEVTPQKPHSVPSMPTSTPTQHPLLALLPPTYKPGEVIPTPTPDPEREAPTIRTEILYHVVQPGETLGLVAANYGISISQLSAVNRIYNPDLVSIGQVLTVPAPVRLARGPNFKIIPDSELVFGPSSALFDLKGEINHRQGYLASYTQEIENRILSGAEIVQLVAQRYSVNPRLLVALLEFQGGWLTNSELSWEKKVYPMGYYRPDWGGLFSQLSWAADQLNTGYYLWRAGWTGPFSFASGDVVVPGAGVNAGTVGVQNLFSQLYPVEAWRAVVAEGGFYETLISLFGNPFERATEPLVPQNLEQPQLQLPFEEGKSWSFTSGAHSAWGEGAGWAALDFAPPGPALGCIPSNEWVVAIADGLIIRADSGEVVQDIDGDGYEQTGWVVLYMHIQSHERVQRGKMVRAGDRIGHPSCEGGIATGTNLHIARKFRGEWIPADGPLPFTMDGWVSAGDGISYSGTMSRGQETIESCACRSELNQISR
ncbi:MAG: LysM peptidoglycan-binding domain-containing protein [Anaerolineales bacterium]|nr:LysM peptidoglycan-binding domain-containing protein [Anaerolineales bacterium]